MTLHEALAQRAANRARIEQLAGWARDAARFQEGSTPPESADDLLAQVTELIRDQASLIASINITNATVRTADGELLTDALARRDALSTEHKLRLTVADMAAGHSRHTFRITRSEIPEVAGVPDVAGLRRNVDDLAQQLRKLDATIQAAGMTAELVS